MERGSLGGKDAIIAGTVGRCVQGQLGLSRLLIISNVAFEEHGYVVKGLEQLVQVGEIVINKVLIGFQYCAVEWV